MEKQVNLDKPLTEKEIETTIRILPEVKSRSLDGFRIEFYKE